MDADLAVDRGAATERAAARRRGVFLERFVASGYAHAAPWIPISAGAGIIAALYLNTGPETHQSRETAVLIGLAFAMVVGVVATVVTAGRSTPQYANPRAFAQIMERVRALRVHIDSTVAPPADPAKSGDPRSDPELGLKIAKTQLAFVEDRLCLHAPSTAMDPTWSSAAAYQDLWTAIHRAEEALVDYQTRAELAASIADDLRRVASSALSDAMTAELKQVQTDLNDQKHERVAIAGRLGGIRRQINEFRDGRWDGLITARNHLVRSALMTAWTAFGLLILAVALGAPRDSIAAGGVFFLVGALVGLLAQVRADARRNDVVEDYGLASARLYQTVLASGLAGVAGVLLMPIAIDISGGSANLGPGTTLGTVFNVTQNPGQLLLAGVFGLSPQLLFDRLGATADQYKAQLSSTQVAAGVAPDTGSAVATEG
jgi:hypothetical protein